MIAPNTNRQRITPAQAEERINIQLDRDNSWRERTKEMYGNLILPSYVHGYSLAIQYMYNWFKNKFPNDYFKGGIYIDGKNVLDDYRKLNEWGSKSIVKGQNPRARMAPTVDYDYDRDTLDIYGAPPEMYLRRSKLQQSFFKDYDRNLFLGIVPRALRMNVTYKVRVNTRSQQLDLFNQMELNFRNGATQYEYISADFHIPKSVMLIIAQKAGFEIKNGEVVNIIDFLSYLNKHSEVPFLFKLRAINLQPEFFIRMNNIYTHISVRDKLSLDDGERDGKLDFNFGVEMNATLTIPIPHFYSFYVSEDIKSNVSLKKITNDDSDIALYSINVYEIPKVNDKGWMIGAITDYQTDKGETKMDLSSIFAGNNSITAAINHDLTNGVSPSHFLEIKVYKDEDMAIDVPIDFDWKTKIAKFKEPQPEEILHIAIYNDKEYINELDIELNKMNDSRISKITSL
jgi:hypothetical protein